MRDHADADLSPPAGPFAPLRIRLRDFRNFAALDWRPPAERLLLVGPNGAGKTTLLEAIYLAATGRSFRTARLDACARGGAPAFAVALELGARPRRELVLDWTAAEGAKRRLDGRRSSAAEQLAALPLLVWTQAETALLTGPPALRRRFFDRGLVHLRPALLESLGRYERALAGKRALLAAGGGERELPAWNALLARHGAEIAAARAAQVAAVAAELARVVAESGLDLAPVELAYRPATAAALEGEAALGAALERARAQELARRVPLAGPHRDEIEVRLGGQEARRVASAGERKALGLALLAALARTLEGAGRGPALLLDDADTELDLGRLEQVARAFAGFRTVVATSNRSAAWAASAALSQVAVDELGKAAGATLE